MSKAIDAVVAQLLRAAVTPANTQINEIPENEVDAYVAQMLKAEKTAESTNNVQQKKKKEMRMNDTSYELLEYEYATERIAKLKPDKTFLSNVFKQTQSHNDRLLKATQQQTDDQIRSDKKEKSSRGNTGRTEGRESRKRSNHTERHPDERSKYRSSSPRERSHRDRRRDSELDQKDNDSRHRSKRDRSEREERSTQESRRSEEPKLHHVRKREHSSIPSPGGLLRMDEVQRQINKNEHLRSSYKKEQDTATDHDPGTSSQGGSHELPPQRNLEDHDHHKKESTPAKCKDRESKDDYRRTDAERYRQENYHLSSTHRSRHITKRR